MQKRSQARPSWRRGRAAHSQQPAQRVGPALISGKFGVLWRTSDIAPDVSFCLRAQIRTNPALREPFLPWCRGCNRPSPDMKQSYGWQRFYESAILETERSRLPGLIQAAQAAIDARTAQLQSQPDGADERQALEDAQAGLTLLRKEVITPTLPASPQVSGPRQ